jgi:hypothetical protein
MDRFPLLNLVLKAQKINFTFLSRHFFGDGATVTVTRLRRRRRDGPSVTVTVASLQTGTVCAFRSCTLYIIHDGWILGRAKREQYLWLDLLLAFVNSTSMAVRADELCPVPSLIRT